ncbi:MAG: hypothetical protein HC933_19915 [Pleurocapsa sp. SU_196_0]|nr:hypothetical protein [Pleurocapsa sp. SU_196_0]
MCAGEARLHSRGQPQKHAFEIATTPRAALYALFHRFAFTDLEQPQVFALKQPKGTPCTGVNKYPSALERAS